MIYRLILISDEVDDFLREIHIDSESTFLDLHNIILDSVKYSKDQLTSFFVCSDDWEKEQEITQIEMDTSSEYDNYIMSDTKLEELISEEGQKLLFVFDMMNERSFYIELKETIFGKELDKPKCVVSKGKAPVQMVDGLFLDTLSTREATGAYSFDDEFDDEDFNEDELEDLNISDDYFSDQQF